MLSAANYKQVAVSWWCVYIHVYTTFVHHADRSDKLSLAIDDPFERVSQRCCGACTQSAGGRITRGSRHGAAAAAVVVPGVVLL